MKDSNIQWTDGTINPVMGCDGCELWPSKGKVVKHMKEVLTKYVPSQNLNQRIESLVEERDIEAHKDLIARIVCELVLKKTLQKAAIRECKSVVKCYAGVLTENRAGKVKGYPDRFENPTLYAGRTTAAASYSDLFGQRRPNKPWLDGMPRLIFVSDMGDALSQSISFESLLEEVILPAESKAGSRHVWLWLTKRPTRMAEFAEWLESHGGHWPANLVAMTSVTSEITVGRVAQLCKVPSTARGLSVEPLAGPVILPLEGIDWVIVGGESGSGAATFDVEWARSIQRQCREKGVAFFCKQLGATAIDNGELLELKHSHGGDWSEWPEDLRVRELPEKFKHLTIR